ALATGLGAVPLAFARGKARRSWVGIGDGVAAGMMTAATAALVYEGCTTSAWRTVAGAAAGTIFMALVWKLFSKHDHPRMGTQLVPDALEVSSRRTVGLAAGIAAAAMLVLQALLLGV